MTKKGTPRIGETVRIVGGVCDKQVYCVVERPQGSKRDNIWWAHPPDWRKENAGFFDVGVGYETISPGAAKNDVMPDDIDVKLKNRRDSNLRNCFWS